MRNDYEIRGETTAIFIVRKNGDIHEVLVDTNDLNKLLAFDAKWSLSIIERGTYVRTPLYNENRKSIGSIYLNRFLLDFPEDNVVSYISDNTLDNRRENLKVTPYHQKQKENAMKRERELIARMKLRGEMKQ